MSKTWRGAFDGACLPSNPGNMGIGCWLTDPDGGEVWHCSEFLGYGTNNIAEWTALVRLLQSAVERKAFPLKITGDSQLIINQYNGEFAIRNPSFVSLAKRAWSLTKGRKVDILWVPRKQNKRADQLSESALQVIVPVRFPASRLKAVGTSRYIAHGTKDYEVNTTKQTCTCPAFQFNHGPCKHLLTANHIERDGSIERTAVQP